MRRLHLVALLGLSLAAGLRAGGPQAKATPKPPWQCLLTGADARQAAALDKRIVEREKADRYPEAVSAAEELLALRTRAQGPDHWEAANARWTLAGLRKVAALSEQKRLGWRKAAQAAAEAGRLEQQARYAKALPLRQQHLTWCREVLGEDHPETATSYNNLAVNLNAQGNSTAAGPLFQKALAIRQRLVETQSPSCHRAARTSGL